MMNSTVRKRSFFQDNFSEWKNILFEGLLFSAFFAFMEIFFHITEELEVTSSFIYPLFFSLPLGFFFTAVFSVFSEKVNCILSTVTACLAGVWYCTQICYASVFQTYMEISKITLAGQVAEGFGGEMKDAVIDNIPKIIAVILIIAAFSLSLFVYLHPRKKTPILCGTALVVCLILHLICKGTLLFGGNGAYAPKNMYNQVPRVLDNNIQNFGVMTSFRLELNDMVFGGRSSEEPSFETVKPGILDPIVTTPIATNPVDSGSDPSEPAKPAKVKNVIDINYDDIIKSETDKKLLSIHNYVNSQSGSYVNQYTGYFEGYNLITICAESFSSHFISPELTPTLYKMANGGFVFNNYYGMMKSITTNGEYAFCTGLIPNSQGNVNDLKKNSTFLLSSDKYLPFCLGNVFSNMGATTCAYHSNQSTTYKRNLTHPNMGYHLCRFLEGGYVDGVFDKELKMTFSTKNSVPNSDYECAQQTLDDYLSIKNEDGSVKQFHAYYMTYSGHHPYYDIADTTHTQSPMTRRNRDIVDNLPYNERLKSYIAANLEVEKMVTEIINRLTEAGCLNNTVIVLSNDHYPYGLYDSEFSALAGYKVDTTFGIFKNSFICYCAGMETPVIVDTPCCTVDIIPTILNLFGVDYDSRLLAGTDILDPNSFHIAMLYNQSFITDKIKYDTKKNKITYLVDENDVPDGYTDACVAYVKNKFEISLQIVKNDYYRFFFDELDRQNSAS